MGERSRRKLPEGHGDAEILPIVSASAPCHPCPQFPIQIQIGTGRVNIQWIQDHLTNQTINESTRLRLPDGHHDTLQRSRSWQPRAAAAVPLAEPNSPGKVKGDMRKQNETEQRRKHVHKYDKYGHGYKYNP